MKAPVYVGRVGGLAVALGVGAASAVLGAPGVAWASPEQSASSSQRGGSASEKTSGRSEGSGRTVRSGAGRVSADPIARDTAGPAMPAVESDTAPRSRGVRAPLKDPTTLTVPAAAREKSQAAGDSPRPSASVAVIAEPPIAGQVVAEQVEGPLVDKVAPAAEPVVVVDAAALAESATSGGSAVGAVAAPVMAAAEVTPPPAEGGVVESVLDPSSGPGPVAPLGTAVSWVMLAAARRELSGQSAASSLPAVALPTGQGLDAGDAEAPAPAGPAAAASAESPRTVPTGVTASATPESEASQGALAGADAAPRVLRAASAASTVTPKDEIDLLFGGLNSSIGWIPVVGTVINALKFGIDAVGLVGSVLSLDIDQAITELGNLVVDTIGLVPIVGAPIAALLYQTVLGGNAKLGSVVQASLQNYLDVDSTWSQYQFYVEAVDVSIGLGGSHPSIATVSKPNYAGVGVLVDVTNTGFESGWSVPLEGRLQLLALAFS